MIKERMFWNRLIRSSWISVIEDEIAEAPKNLLAVFPSLVAKSSQGNVDQ